MSSGRWEALQAGIWAADYRVPMFDSRTLAICLEELQGGETEQSNGNGRTWVLTSPGPDLVESFKQDLWRDEDRVAGLVTPSSYHNLGLKVFKEAFPSAKIVAAASGHKRLAARGFDQLFDSMQGLSDYGVELHPVPGTKNGELWISVKHETSPLLAVGDAIFNLPPGGSLGLRLFKLVCRAGPGLTTDLPYRMLFLQNTKAFGAWAQALFDELKPTTFVPVHGTILRAPELQTQAAEYFRGLVA